MFPHCGRDSMVEFQLPKLTTRVRFPSPAPLKLTERRPRDGVRIIRESAGQVSFLATAAFSFSLWSPV